MKGLSFCLSISVYAGVLSAASPSPQKPPVTPTPQKSYTEQILAPKAQSAPLHKPDLSLKEHAKPLSAEYVYTSPGTAMWQGADWVGNDNLNNLSKNLGIYTEVIQSSHANVSINEEEIKEKISAIIKSGGVESPSREINPLPFLHVLIMLQPIEKGFAAYCALRLFEQVDNRRVHFKPGIFWQTITWEKQELILSPPDALQSQLLKTFREMAKSFADQYKQR